MLQSIILIILLGVTLGAAILFVVKQHKDAVQRNNKKEIQASLSIEREEMENIRDANIRQYLSSPDRFQEANNLLIYEHKVDKQDNPIRNDSFLKSLLIDIDKVMLRDNQIMCLMPFNEKYKPLYDSIVNACASVGFTTKRSDDKFDKDHIMSYIIKSILESKYVIACIDTNNPNVAFELGVAEAYGKNIIKIANVANSGGIPLDYDRQDRKIYYSHLQDLEIQLSKAILSFEKYYDRDSKNGNY